MKLKSGECRAGIALPPVFNDGKEKVNCWFQSRHAERSKKRIVHPKELLIAGALHQSLYGPGYA